MVTNYQMWITYNAEAEKLRIPVLPEKFTVSIGSSNSSVDVAGLGEIVIKQARPAFQFSFESFFPKKTFPGVSVSSPTAPLTCVSKLKSWHNGDKPVHLILTDVGINLYCTIESFTYYEQGGDVGTIHYSLTLKEYREVTVRSVTVNTSTSVASVTSTQTRVDNSATPETYTVKSGDCLWNIAKKYYGSGSKYTVIYNANKSVIGSNPNLIYPGQVLTIPSA
ncbi:MAG: LysM peptidoglycan-binding domain-containing protein [Ruminococcus sp.]|nr:LysM peptidoglycan-binding domain-containing protein [Ruminococcus sp.]